MSTIFCDNDGCMFSDGCGFCDCDKLSIVGGVCEGSMHGGRNASDGDIDERFKAENAKLRELAKAAWGCVNRHVSCDECRMSCGGCTLQSAMHELGVGVDG